MDVSKLTRDPVSVRANLISLPSGEVVAKEDCYIHIPAEYVDKQLAFLDGYDKQILGIFAISVGDKYALWSTPNMYSIQPQEFSRYLVDEAEYISIYIPANSVVFTTLDVVMADYLAYEIYDLYTDTDIAPWFLSYLDRAKLLDDTDHYMGPTFGAKWSVIKLVWAFTARQQQDKTKSWRTLLKTQEDVNRIIPAYVPFKSVIYGPKSTFSKLNGAYFDIGLDVALVTETEKPSDLEKILRV